MDRWMDHPDYVYNISSSVSQARSALHCHQMWSTSKTKVKKELNYSMVKVVFAPFSSSKKELHPAALSPE
jgi:hypothetical protein